MNRAASTQEPLSTFFYVINYLLNEVTGSDVRQTSQKNSSFKRIGYTFNKEILNIKAYFLALIYLECNKVNNDKTG